MLLLKLLFPSASFPTSETLQRQSCIRPYSLFISPFLGLATKTFHNVGKFPFPFLSSKSVRDATLGNQTISKAFFSSSSSTPKN